MLVPPNKAMKLTSLSAAPGLNGEPGVDGGAASPAYSGDDEHRFR